MGVEQTRKLGISVPKTLARKYEAESGLGSALADALRAMESADVALMNSGGFRAANGTWQCTFGDGGATCGQEGEESFEVEGLEP